MMMRTMMTLQMCLLRMNEPPPVFAFSVPFWCTDTQGGESVRDLPLFFHSCLSLSFLNLVGFSLLGILLCV